MIEKYKEIIRKDKFPNLDPETSAHGVVKDLQSLLKLYQSQGNIINDKLVMKMQNNKNRWKRRYIARLILRKLSKKEALENYTAIDGIDFTINPESCADDEISYMKGD